MKLVTVDRDTLDRTLEYVRHLEDEIEDFEYGRDPYGTFSFDRSRPECIKRLKDVLSGKPATFTGR